MSLDQIVNAIIDDTVASPYLRAIRLYELQVAIFYPQSFGALVTAKNDTRGANKKLRTARIYAGIKFLEQIEDELREKTKNDTISIHEFAQNKNYQEIFDGVIAPNGGWSRIRHSISVKEFDNGLLERRDLAGAAAKVVDFSYRFEDMPDRGSYRGGLSTARYVVVNAKSYNLSREIGTTKSRWRDFGKTGAFLYLLLIQNFSLMPPKLASKTFSKKLLDQVADVGSLRKFFRAYQHVCEALVPRGYKFENIALNLNCEAPSLPKAALQPDVIAAFKKSLGAQK
jgi:hypothetical protein